MDSPGLPISNSMMSRSGSENGSGRHAAATTLYTAVASDMPSASDSAAPSEKPGLRRSRMNAARSSLMIR